MAAFQKIKRSKEGLKSERAHIGRIIGLASYTGPDCPSPPPTQLHRTKEIKLRCGVKEQTTPPRTEPCDTVYLLDHTGRADLGGIGIVLLVLQLDHEPL